MKDEFWNNSPSTILERKTGFAVWQIELVIGQVLYFFISFIFWQCPVSQVLKACVMHNGKQ